MAGLTRVVGTPAVYISGVLIPVVPNSVSYKGGGERNVRAMSAGGNSVEVVVGVDASKMLAEVHFELPSTPENIRLAEQISANANNGKAETIMLVDKGFQKAFDQMVRSNEDDIQLKSDGNIKFEYKGRYAA
jgi:hypothetical protein